MTVELPEGKDELRGQSDLVALLLEPLRDERGIYFSRPHRPAHPCTRTGPSRRCRPDDGGAVAVLGGPGDFEGDPKRGSDGGLIVDGGRGGRRAQRRLTAVPPTGRVGDGRGQ